jgi:hypothetical protein
MKQNLCNINFLICIEKERKKKTKEFSMTYYLFHLKVIKGKKVKLSLFIIN